MGQEKSDKLNKAAFLGRSGEIYPPRERRNVVVSDINTAQAYTELMREGIKEKYGVSETALNMASQLLTTMDTGAWVTARSLWEMGNDQQVPANFAKMAKVGKWNVMGVESEKYEEYLGHVFQMTVVSEKVRMARAKSIIPDSEIVRGIRSRLTGGETLEPEVQPGVVGGDDDFGKWLDQKFGF